MAMNWIRGLVAPAAENMLNQGAQAMQGMQGGQNPGQNPYGGAPGGPPVGGMQSPYGVAQNMMPGAQNMMPGAQNMMPGAQNMTPMATTPSAFQPMEWSTGTRTQGQAQAAPGQAPTAQAAQAAQVAQGSLAQGAQGPTAQGAATLSSLEHDVQSLALFARTLLTVLEAKNVFTRAEFEEAKKQLDMLDGKLDDR